VGIIKGGANKHWGQSASYKRIVCKMSRLFHYDDTEPSPQEKRPRITTEDVTMADVLKKQEVEAALKVKVSRMEKNVFESIFELVNLANEYPGQFEDVVKLEGAEREKKGKSRDEYKAKLLNKAYELIFATESEYSKNVDEDYKLYQIYAEMGLNVPKEIEHVGDESASEKDITEEEMNDILY